MKRRAYAVPVIGIWDGVSMFRLLLLNLHLKQAIPGKLLLFFIQVSRMEYMDEQCRHAPPLVQPYWNKKVYTDIARQQATGDRFSYWLNIRLFRYADVLLMAAEAANEIGRGG